MKTLKQFLIESEKKVDADKALAIGNKYNVDWKKYNKEQFQVGLGVEMEHSETVGNDMKIVTNIVLDHLDEDPMYYTKLKSIE